MSDPIKLREWDIRFKRRGAVLNAVAILTALVGATVAGFAVFEQMQRATDQVVLQLTGMQPSPSAADVFKQVNSIVDEKLRAIPPISTEAVHFVAEIDKLKADLATVSESTLAVRQALNPTDPESVLTIARLRDKVSDIERRFDRLEAQLDKKYNDFTASTLREIAASTSSIWSLALAMLPLTLPLLFTLAYNFYRDYRTPPTPPPSQN